MSIPIAGRCGVLVALMTSSFSCAVAQQKMPPTLRERAAKEGHVRTGAIVDYTCCSDLTELVKHSDIIVRGQVTDSKARLSDDERRVWTDYTINIQEVYKQIGNQLFVPGAKIQVTTMGGQLLVDGHPVEFNVSPPIPKGIVEMFFITACTDMHCAGPYLFVGGDGAISLDNGQVTCSAKPDGIQKPYCGTTADSFISAVKVKVASSISAGSPK